MLAGLPAGADRLDQIGLAGEEGGGLEHVDDLGDRLDLRHLVHVGQHRQAGLAAHLFEDAQPLLQPRPAERGAGGAVRLVERALVDQQDAEPLGDARQASRRWRAPSPPIRSRTARRSGTAAHPARSRGRKGSVFVIAGPLTRSHASRQPHATPSRASSASIGPASCGLLSSQMSRPRAATSTTATGAPMSRKRSCSSPSSCS